MDFLDNIFIRCNFFFFAGNSWNIQTNVEIYTCRLKQLWKFRPSWSTYVGQNMLTLDSVVGLQSE